MELFNYLIYNCNLLINLLTYFLHCLISWFLNNQTLVKRGPQVSRIQHFVQANRVKPLKLLKLIKQKQQIIMRAIKSELELTTTALL